MSIVNTAIQLAAKLHSGQYRKNEFVLSEGVVSKLPYITHPIEVMKLVWQTGIGTDINLAAAVLHDTIEDCNVSKEKLHDLFLELNEELIGEKIHNVLDIVEELTFDPKQMSKVDYMKSFETKSLEAIVIKYCDRICNYIDFMLFDPKYAVKYLKKADVLFDIYQNSLSAIKAKYPNFVDLNNELH